MAILPFVDAPEPDVVIAVYDAKTGAIRHVHQEIFLPGSQPPASEEQVRRAIALATEIGGKTTARFAALAIAPADRSRVLRSSVPLKVDLKKRAIVAVAATRATKAAPARRRR